jgi:hypothetical protein
MTVTTQFLWDDRPGRNVDHITEHGMSTDLWESVYWAATRRGADKDDPTIMVAEGTVDHRLYRIIYAILDQEHIIPVSIFPVTGFPIKRRGLR